MRTDHSCTRCDRRDQAPRLPEPLESWLQSSFDAVFDAVERRLIGQHEDKTRDRPRRPDQEGLHTNGSTKL